MLFKPGDELISADESGRQVDHQTFLFMDSTLKFEPVEQQEYLHCGVCYALVALDERMVQGQCVAPSVCRSRA